MSTFLHAYELKGVKEQVADAISNISPQETPFTSMTRKGSAHQIHFEWLTDIDAEPTVAGTGVQQGSDAVFVDLVEPKRLSSWTQIFSVSAKVDATAQATGLYGRGDPIAYHMMKKGREIKKVIEKTLLSKQSGKTASSGVGSMLDGVLTRRADANAPKIPDANIKQAAAAKTFVEAELQELLNTLWVKGAKPSVIMFPPAYAGVISSLRETDNTRVNMFDGDVSATVNTQVTTYVDPLGQRFKLIPNRYMPEDVMYVLDPSMFEQKVLRNFKSVDLPANGDYVAKMLTVELGLANTNPDACGVYNLTGAAITAAARSK